MMIDNCRMVESLRSISLQKDRIRHSMFDIGRSMFDVHWLLIGFDYTHVVRGSADT